MNWPRRQVLSNEERRRLVEAIEAAERLTSVEIRVVVEQRCKGDPYERAKSYFERLGMTQTAQRNGVLIYVARKSRRFAILGDEGIHRQVTCDFWHQLAAQMRAFLQKDPLVPALCNTIAHMGQVFARYFPPRPDDINELPDEASTY